MTRKIKRSENFDIALQVKNDDFINPPREAQRNWLLNRAVAEFNDDLIALNELAKRFVSGREEIFTWDHGQELLQEQVIMEDWQIPVMEAMADIVTETPGDVLEVGFGRGISADFIQQRGVKSHTIIECNNNIMESLNNWRASKPDQDIRLLHGMWQDLDDQLQTYDGVFFHTYPLNKDQHEEYVVKSATFAEHFFPTAAKHLRKGGTFTYLTNEIDSFSRAHQRLVFKYFESFTLKVIEKLKLPENCIDTLWADSMVVIKAVK